MNEQSRLLVSSKFDYYELTSQAGLSMKHGYINISIVRCTIHRSNIPCIIPVLYGSMLGCNKLLLIKTLRTVNKAAKYVANDSITPSLHNCLFSFLCKILIQKRDDVLVEECCMIVYPLLAGDCSDDDHFLCETGKCISNTDVCNGFDNCNDFSDERQCSKCHSSKSQSVMCDTAKP